MNKKYIGSLLSLFGVLLVVSDLFTASMGVTLAWAGLWDLKERVIPNLACVFVMLYGFIEILSGNKSDMRSRAFGILLMLVVLLAMKLILADKIGMGDIKLLMASSFCLAPITVAWAFAFACLSAGIFGYIATKTLKGEVPLGPFLAVSLTVMRMVSAV